MGKVSNSKMLTRDTGSIVEDLPTLRARSLVVSDLRSETKGSRFEQGRLKLRG